MESIVLADPITLEVFARDVFMRIDVPLRQAEDAARVLVWANLRGVDTHGVRNLDLLYVRMLDEGRIRPDAVYAIDHETPFSARADGGSGLGMAAGVWAMRMAIEKAAVSGSGMVAMRNSQHFGAAGFYANMAIERNMMGLCLTGRFMPQGASIGLVPTFSSMPMFSTNPIAFAAPTMNEPTFLLDMATTITPYNRVTLYNELGLEAEQGWGTDDDGLPTTDPARINRLHPLGGTREMGSHKGYGLAMVVEILASVLSGEWSNGHDGDGPAFDGFGQPNDGHFFAAIRVDAFQPVDDFKLAMDVMIRALHEAPKQEGHDRIFVAGEMEYETEVERRQNGVPLPPNVQEGLTTLAERFGLQPPF